MSDPIDDLQLAAEFPPASRDDWRKLAEGVLKGAPFEKLMGKTYDGLPVEPIYSRAQNAPVVAGRAAPAPWAVVQRVEHPDPAQANAQALHDLENGATGLTLVFAGAASAYGFGLDPSAEAVARATDGIHFDAGIAIEVEIGPQSRLAALHLAELIKTRGQNPGNCAIRFGLDPLPAIVSGGSSPYDWSQIATAIAGGAKELAKAGFKGPFVAADGRAIHNAGGSEAQELAFVLASGVAYLRALESAGVALDEARTMVEARVSADADQFLTVAKLRALRQLWARVEVSCGLTPRPLFIAAETSWRMLTQRDPDVNMLRATIATFSAGVGGANAITVLPHTLALGLPDPFARRVARNTQLILLEESNLAKVADPAAGSGGVETLTRELCASAWSLFQEIERAGGVFAALQASLIQRKVADISKARDTNIARRKDVVTGVSEFPNLLERKPEVLPATPVELPPYGEAKIRFEPLVPSRLAVPFERLRDASDRMLTEAGTRPKVLLALLGKPSDFTARMTFTRSFFEAGGIEAVESSLAETQSFFTSPRARGEVGLRSNPGEGQVSETTAPHPNPLPAGGERERTLVCLCSSDKVYAEQAVAAAKALTTAGARHIYLAGRPGDLEGALRDAGVSDFVFAGGNALATLEAAYTKMGAVI